MDRYILMLMLGFAYIAVVLVAYRAKMWGSANASLHGPVLVWRTLKGRGMLTRLAEHRRFWKVAGWGCVLVVFAAMVFITSFLVIVTFFAPSVVESATDPAVVSGATPIINPWATLIYAIAAIGLAMFVHEMGHGIMAIANRIRVESIGVMIFTLPIGAFVETNDDDMEAAGPTASLKVYSAGPAANFLVAVVFLILFLGVFAPSAKPVLEGALVTDIVLDSPADLYGIPTWAQVVSVDGVRVEDSDDLQASYVNDPGGFITVQYHYKSGVKGAVLPGGVVVSDVPSGPAFNAGIEPGMIIRSLNDTIVHSIEDLRIITENSSHEVPVNITVLRYHDDPSLELGWFVEDPYISTVNLTSKWQFYYVHYQDELMEEYRNQSSLGVECAMFGLIAVDSDQVPNLIARPLSDASGADGYARSALQFLALPFLGYMPLTSPATALYEPSGALSFVPDAVFWLLLNAVYWIFWANLITGLANALPAYPLDGGVILRRALRWLRGKNDKKLTGLEKYTTDRWFTSWESDVLIDMIVGILTIVTLVMFAWHIIMPWT